MARKWPEVGRKDLLIWAYGTRSGVLKHIWKVFSLFNQKIHAFLTIHSFFYNHPLNNFTVSVIMR